MNLKQTSETLLKSLLTDLAVKLRGRWVTPELNHGSCLAQAVGSLAAVVGKVLLSDAWHSERVPFGVPVMGDQVAPPTNDILTVMTS